jgi:biopolymer transport protein ExbD
MSQFNGRRRRTHGLGEVTEINVMPLVDLLLQLFIAAIIFFPVVEYGMNIKLPKATTNTIKRENSRTVSVDKAGKFFINDVVVTRDQMRTEFAKLSKSEPDVTVLLKADEANNYGAVVEVLKELHAANISRIALITQEDTPPRGATRASVSRR